MIHTTHIARLLAGGVALPCAVSHASLADWQAQVETGTAVASKYFKDVDGPVISGAYPVSWDVGALEGDRSFEFIVFAGEAGGSSALLGYGGVQGLKFEQWNDTRSLGLTDYGVADHVSTEPSPFYAETHLVYAFDGADTQLYVNGELKYTFAGVALDPSGQQWLGAVSDATGSFFGDPLDGRILGFASYDVALPAAEVSAHHSAFAAGSSPFSLEAWQAAVAAETAPAITVFTPVSGLAPAIVDVGDLAGVPATFEFVIHAGDGGVSSALAGRGGAGGQGLKFEQWNNTRSFGLTNFGVVDLTSDVEAPFDSLVHVAYVSDGVSTELYLDGEWRYTFDGAPLNLGGEIGLAAAATIAVVLDGTTFRDPLDGSVLRFASYDSALTEDEIIAHQMAFAADGGAGAFTAWQAAVAAGTAPVATRTEPSAAVDQVTVDVGPLTDDRTFEFIVHAGDAGPSGSIFGDAVQSLRFEQWNNTGTMGLTVYGVADHVTSVAPPLLTDTHIVFTSDGTDTQLYVDGVLQHTFAGIPLTGAGIQGLATSAATTVGGTTVTYFDRLDGHVLGFAAYASALAPAELVRHADALRSGGEQPVASLRVTAVSRDSVTGQLTLTWTSTPGKLYDILQSGTLAAFNQVAAAGVPAGAGATTTYTLAAPVPAAGQMFFRVKEL
jgi:hypothetical protein